MVKCISVRDRYFVGNEASGKRYDDVEERLTPVQDLRGGGGKKESKWKQLTELEKGLQGESLKQDYNGLKTDVCLPLSIY